VSESNPDRPTQATVPLEHPIQTHGNEVRELTLRRPRTKEFRLAVDRGKGNMGVLCELIAGAARIPPSSVDQLELDDLLVVQEKLLDLLPQSFREMIEGASPDPDAGDEEDEPGEA